MCSIVLRKCVFQPFSSSLNAYCFSTYMAIVSTDRSKPVLLYAREGLCVHPPGCTLCVCGGVKRVCVGGEDVRM